MCMIPAASGNNVDITDRASFTYHIDNKYSMFSTEMLLMAMIHVVYHDTLWILLQETMFKILVHLAA